ncbi:hypothetical protein F0562_013275 [Nyssa sinensis]|uniref:Uncharacterized protein n=1 Tax=Nyssa sinensis TaxID=561372 RepID=A0A5J4ZWU2_9ASTE|nr:hypothetical protein F0562_013275 [Nyssa sinensis]
MEEMEKDDHIMIVEPARSKPNFFCLEKIPTSRLRKSFSFSGSRSRNGNYGTVAGRTDRRISWRRLAEISTRHHF